MKYKEKIEPEPGVSEVVWQSAAWPFEEARKIVERYKDREFPQMVLFETGYGPSGLPHIGTFGEVVRTSMVRHAFRVLTEDRVQTQLLCFSDDMDGMRKIPENVPQREMLMPHIGKPLNRVPDPFGQSKSFGDHNNALLKGFLDGFGFDYTFASACDYYRSGRFDDGLIRILAKYDEIMRIMLPTLREERRKTYSPILPIHPETGVVMQVPMEEVHPERGMVVWTDPDTKKRWETNVTGGACKAQWKADWALRWHVLRVDYEMYGKDHIDNVKTSRKICHILGGKGPAGFNYELFLDENGEKIAKSKGNGITIEQWLSYAPAESLALYMFQKPGTAKKLFFGVIPKAVDEYYACLSAFPNQNTQQKLANPVWHLHQGSPPHIDMPVSFALLLNLVSASNADEKSVLWGFIVRHFPLLSPENCPELDRLTGYAIRYFNDYVKPEKVYLKPDKAECDTLQKLCKALESLPFSADSEKIQNAALDVGRTVLLYQDPSKRNMQGEPAVSSLFFRMIYRTLIGQEKGPRFGSFVALYGLKETCELITKAIKGELADRNHGITKSASLGSS